MRQGLAKVGSRSGQMLSTFWKGSGQDLARFERCLPGFGGVVDVVAPSPSGLTGAIDKNMLGPSPRLHPSGNFWVGWWDAHEPSFALFLATPGHRPPRAPKTLGSPMFSGLPEQKPYVFRGSSTLLENKQMRGGRGTRMKRPRAAGMPCTPEGTSAADGSASIPLGVTWVAGGFRDTRVPGIVGPLAHPDPGLIGFQ